MTAANNNREIVIERRTRGAYGWKVVVFPSLAAFFLLAAYGFYLIYNLVGDIHRVADAVEVNMDTVAGQMQQISANLDELTGSVHNISVNLDDLTGRVRSMGDTLVLISTNVQTLPSMLADMDAIDKSMHSMDGHLAGVDDNVELMNRQMSTMTNLMGSMSIATHQVNRNVAGVNQSFGRPMSFFNSFMPW